MVGFFVSNINEIEINYVINYRLEKDNEIYLNFVKVVVNKKILSRTRRKELNFLFRLGKNWFS